MDRYEELIYIIGQISSQTGALTNSKKAEAKQKLAALLPLNSKLEILTTRPTTDESKAGQQFLYKGRVWVYHTQEMLDELGWSSLVNVGYPAPLDKIYDVNQLFQSDHPTTATGDSVIDLGAFVLRLRNDFPGDKILDFVHLGARAFNTTIIEIVLGGTLTAIKGAELLSGLEDGGTESAFVFSAPTGNVSGEVLDDFFTQLPETTKTATIDISSTGGQFDCDTTIATNKGYTVVT